MGKRFFLVAGGHRLEAEWHGRPSRGPALVMLHEGLGSISIWRDWPESLARDTGLPVLVYSRAGYGGSDPITPPRPLRYMHDEAAVLQAVLEEQGIASAILVGHSDGASISLLHAGAHAGKEVRGIVLLSPHVFCEAICVEAAMRARSEFVAGPLRAALTRHHGDNVEGAFWGWNLAWTDPDFARWNIEDVLPAIATPVLVVQGNADPYGTLAQVDAIERGVSGPFTKLILPGAGHSPHRERREETTRAVVAFVASLRDP